MSNASVLVLQGAMHSSLRMIGHTAEPISANISERHRTFSEKPIIEFKRIFSLYNQHSLKKLANNSESHAAVAQRMLEQNSAFYDTDSVALKLESRKSLRSIPELRHAPASMTFGLVPSDCSLVNSPDDLS